jgi:hypothetical protein
VTQDVERPCVAIGEHLEGTRRAKRRHEILDGAVHLDRDRGLKETFADGLDDFGWERA